MLWQQGQTPQVSQVGGTQFVRGAGGGWSAVKETNRPVGLEGSNEEYFMQDGELYKKNLKTGVTTTVPNKATEDYKRADVAINKQAGETGVDVEKLKQLDLAHENVQYWKTDATGMPIEKISTAEANKLSADKKQPMPVAVLPSGEQVPYKLFNPEEIRQFQKAQEAVKTVPPAFQSRSASAFGGRSAGPGATSLKGDAMLAIAHGANADAVRQAYRAKTGQEPDF